jgi:hypothetical protein
MHFWKDKSFLLALLIALIVGWGTAVVEAQTEAESGYPAPPVAATPESSGEEPYPPPGAMTPEVTEPLVPLPPASLEDDQNGDPASSPGEESFDLAIPSVGSDGGRQPDPVPESGGAAGAARPAASSLISKLFLWLAFIAALLILIAALLWSIFLFNRQAVRGR